MSDTRQALLAPLMILAACQAEKQADAPTPASTATLAAATAVAVPAPDLAACPARPPVDEGLRERTKPIPVPPALRDVMASNVDNFALTTLGGATTCVDASWLETIRNPTLSPDGRFAAFDWDGYEAFGHVIVDRTGKGQVLDTGVPPVASPSGKLLAAVDLSESGFGALNAFAVWRIEPDRVREIAKQDDAPSAYDWRVEKWAGESCVELSSVPWESFTAETSGPREPYRARANNGWKLAPGRCSDA